MGVGSNQAKVCVPFNWTNSFFHYDITSCLHGFQNRFLLLTLRLVAADSNTLSSGFMFSCLHVTFS